MKVYLPSNNPQSRGYLNFHRAYDFRGSNLPDEVRSGMDGQIIERVDVFTTNWTNTGTLTTRDYGNYIKVRHADGTFALFAHLKKGSSFLQGTLVKTGQIIARIGNTGNSTGPHLHAEYRNSSNKNVEVEFYTTTIVPQPTTEIIATKDLIDLRRKEDAYNIIVDYLGGDKTKVTGVQIIEEFKKKR